MLEKIKEMRKMFVLPKGWELAVLLFFLALYMFGAVFVLDGDGGFGYSMVEKMANPQAFAPNDLSVNGNLAGNFLFYKTLYYLPFFQKNFVAVDFIVSGILSLLLLLAWYNIFFELSGKRLVAAASVIITLFIDMRLSLGGTTLPLFYLNSIAAVLFAQTFAFFFFLKGRPVLAFALLSLTTYWHPPSGLFFLLVLGILFLIQSIKAKRYRPLIWSLAIAGAIFLPNMFILNSHIGPVYDTEKFFRIFRSLYGSPNSSHIYIESYWQAYVFTFAAWLVCCLAYYKKQLRFKHDANIIKLVWIIFLVVGLWLVNVYFIKQLQIFYLYFSMRSTYLLKPLFILMLVNLAFVFWERGVFTARLIVLALLGALFLRAIPYGVGLMALVAFYLFFNVESWPITNKLNTAVSNHGIWFRRVLLFVSVGLFLFLINTFLYQHNNKLYKAYRFLRGENLFNFSFDPATNFGLNKQHPPYAEVVDWAKRYQGKMFITPPDNCLFSTSFRWITKNSIYSNICDVGQLNYTPAYFFQSFDRLLELGASIIGRGKIDYAGYNMLVLSELKTKEADFVIFDKTSSGYVNRPEKPVFENVQYTIYSLKQ